MDLEIIILREARHRSVLWYRLYVESKKKKKRVVVGSLSRVWLSAPTDCSPPGSSVHGISQARILEWVVISFARGSSQPRDQNRIQPTSPSPSADQTPDGSVFFPKGSFWSCWRGRLNMPPLSLSWIHSGSTHKTEQAHSCSSVTSLLTSVHTQNRSQGNKGLQRRKETEIDWTISILTGPSKEHLWLLHASNLQLHPQPMTLGYHTPGIWNLEVPWRT